MIRRINLYGGPGCSKSVTAARLFAALSVSKTPKYSVEHVQEYVKDWAYMGRKPVSYDQIYIFAKQLHKEDLLLRHVSHIVTDSPLLTGVVYAKYAKFQALPELIRLSEMFDRTYPPLNIVLDREGIEYVENGRFQTFEQAKEIDREIFKTVNSYSPAGSLHSVRAVDFDQIVDLVKSKL